LLIDGGVHRVSDNIAGAVAAATEPAAAGPTGETDDGH
jgi:hypothetical protein